MSASFNEPVQVRHLDEDDDFSDEEDLAFDDYINMDVKGDTDTVMESSRENIPEFRRA